MSDATKTRSPWTIWDVATALVVGIVNFAIALAHQEELWVCFLSGGIVAVLVLALQPPIRRLSNRPRR